MENMENIEGSKKKKKWKAKLILIFVLIIIPLSILTFMYFNNKSFNTRANNLLSKLPGKLGYKFANSDDKDNEYKKEYLANYLLSLDPDAAVDKLYIIKKEDEKLYAEIIRNMNANSPTKTGEIITMVRNREQSKDLLSSMCDEIEKGKEKEFMDEINRLENQDLLITIKEVTNRIENDKDFKDNLSEVFSLMNEDRVVDILYYLDESYEDEILYSLKSDKKSSIESKLLDKRAKYLRLADLARLYEVKPIEIAVEEIGNTDTYNMNELGIIYKNLSVLKSAEILSKINDDEFIQELFNVIRREEELSGEEESITTEISKTIQFMTEYNEKINDLVTVYEKMSPDKVAKIVEKMMDNDTTVTQLEIFSEPAYEISDSSIVIDVLSRMKNKALSNIMNYISTDKASKLTQMLAEPQI